MLNQGAIDRMWTLGAGMLVPSPVFAAISSPRLIVTDFGKNRLGEISFFVLCFLIFTAGFCWVWNGFHKEFPQLPRFNYRDSLGVMFLWGTALTMVISLVSSFRQSLTPAAMESRSASERAVGPIIPTSNPEIIDRRIRLQTLWRSLSFYANSHESRFPDHISDVGIDVRIADYVTGLPYFLTSDLKLTSPRTILASEPDIHQQRMLLFNDGTIVTEERGGGRPR